MIHGRFETQEASRKEAACRTQWIQQTCAVFPVITEAAEGVLKHMHNVAVWQEARVTLIRIFHLHSHKYDLFEFFEGGLEKGLLKLN